MRIKRQWSDLYLSASICLLHNLNRACSFCLDVFILRPVSSFCGVSPSRSLSFPVPWSPLEAHIPVTSTESPQATWPRERGGVRGPSYIITHTLTHTHAESHKPSGGCGNCYDTEGHFQRRYRIRPGCMGLFCHNLTPSCVRVWKTKTVREETNIYIFNVW